MKGGAGNLYDRIFKENFSSPGKGMMQRILGVQMLDSFTIPGGLHYTLEKHADTLFEVRPENNGPPYIVHVEWQSVNDRQMAPRMLLYHSLIYQLKKLPVRGYVIYAGEQRLSMSDKVEHFLLNYAYEIINLTDLDPVCFLDSTDAEDVLLAILAGKSKGEQKRLIVKQVIRRLKELLQGDERELKRRLVQLEILGGLRNIQEIIIKEEENMIITYDVTKDIRFKQGKAVGMEKGKQRGVKEGIKQGMKKAKESIIRKLLTIQQLSIDDVAQITEMPVSVVKGIKDSSLD
ncbi:Rpn family recombination-promoting nuclease/putative transposase [Sediminibacterium ginsengisoli]|uniref:Uncharacterized protein n=1 Tax=Sediminibacterium ginsengisoli TaxID=413434 RepID=A0A1T4PKS5_9BACT|nr:Rpn family recombination-promoting nuclease/putative transposase [Sediminibacterium ginsengisoli]SJZ92150.1 conserved hypothetical protein (putative transposase or invertase) [Sediminibacterium ginsengisoli]